MSKHLVCTGCGWDARDPLSPKALACCPDGQYVPAALVPLALIAEARDRLVRTGDVGREIAAKLAAYVDRGEAEEGKQ